MSVCVVISERFNVSTRPRRVQNLLSFFISYVTCHCVIVMMFRSTTEIKQKGGGPGGWGCWGGGLGV